MAWSQITFQLRSICLTYRLKKIFFFINLSFVGKSIMLSVKSGIKNASCWRLSCNSGSTRSLVALANHFLIRRIPLKCHRMDHQPFLGLPSIKQFCQFAFVKLESKGPIISRFPNRRRWSCLQFGRQKMNSGLELTPAILRFLTSSIWGARRLQILESKISCY